MEAGNQNQNVEVNVCQNAQKVWN